MLTNKQHEALKTVIAAAMALASEHRKLARHTPPPNNERHVELNNEIANAVNELMPLSKFSPTQ